MQARLAAHDLACRRGDRVLFRGLSLSLEPGDVLHVTGANGIGKSSLLRILSGLLSPYAGTVERDGAVGLLDEKPALDPDQPLSHALAFWRAIDDIGSLDLVDHYLGGGIPVYQDAPAVFPPADGAVLEFDGMHLTQSKPKLDAVWRSPECLRRADRAPT